MHKSAMLRSITYLISPKRLKCNLSATFNNLANPPVPKNTVANLNAILYKEGRNRNGGQGQVDILETLVALRKQKYASEVPLFPEIWIKELLDSPELVSVLRNPSQYGLFLNEFYGCYMLDMLNNTGRFSEAAEVAGLLIDRDLCTSDLCAALVLKSIFQHLKSFKSNTVEAKDIDSSTPSKDEVKKVREKFLQNNAGIIKKMDTIVLGESLFKLCHSGTENELKLNFNLLALALCGKYEELHKFLLQHNKIFYKEMLQLCHSLTTDKSNETLINSLKEAIDSSSRLDSVNDLLNTNVERSALQCEPDLIAKQENSRKQWLDQFDTFVTKHQKMQKLQEQEQIIKITLNDLEVKRQNVWFFEKEDSLDIYIYKQKKYYPKRWFDKKKQPKVIDVSYVPPVIARNV